MCPPNTRHACAPSYPSREELETFLAKGATQFRLRGDKALEQLHWSTTRPKRWPQVLAFAFDHRRQLEALSDDPTRIAAFKGLCAQALLATQARHPQADAQHGMEARHGNGVRAGRARGT